MPYKTDTIFTFDEYKKFNNSIKGKWLTRIIFIIFGIWILYLLFWDFCFLIEEGFFSENFFINLAALIWLGGLYYYANFYFVKKTFYSNKLSANQHSFFEFFEDYFTQKTNDFNQNVSADFSQIKYEDLYKIVETKTNFYLFVGNILAFTIIKQNCSAELIEFLRKIKKEFEK
ncbi:YcxB family protein [Campylobacter sp. VBCF_05 NA6]|uniref:YcxB family protein n=1 Tax=unclassified Campylobacter TaxID=2593542 RepID=UPI0022E9E1E3|nr:MULTISPECIES: YcxB family protein [unclassified Campylobacter]MDA3058114.1 YcxB family protein [Campylobacter sp. VBCF_04 NA7]MDA3059685.1 YcxB family protein [Campylobacter sp. VBCF_05 NA6]